MNFPTFFYQTGRPHLASRAFDVLHVGNLPLPPNAPQGTEVVYRLGNAYRSEYRYHLMGFSRHPSKLYKAAIAFLSQGIEFMPLIVQVNCYLLDELLRMELYEIVPKLLEINIKLADKLEQVFPGVDVTPLRDTDQARGELEKLLLTLEKFKENH